MLQSLKKIHRVEFLIAYFVILLFPVILAAPPLQNSLAVIGFVLLVFAFGNAINSYSDAKSDISNLRKKSISDAVSKIKFLKLLIVAEFIFIAAGAVVLFGSNFVVWILGGIAGFFMLGYSVEPLRFKGRGILHVVSLSLSVYILPPMFVYFALVENIVLGFVALLIFYSLFRTGVSLINNIDDYFEDKKQGIKTTAVAFGVKKTTTSGVIITGFGIIGLAVVLFKLNTPLILIALLSLVGIFILLQEYGVYKQANKSIAKGVKASQEFFKQPKIVNLFDLVLLFICIFLHLTI